MNNHLLGFALFISMLSVVSCLECFTCTNEDSNKGKCRKNTKQCEEFQDACTTYIRWGVPPYWTPRGDRIYYISKDCDTMKGCDRRKAATATHCKRDWYNDWACVECCSGDLCNFFVTLGAGDVRSSIFTILSSLVIGFYTVWTML